MTSADHPLTTVVVPVGLGGKTTPYVPDPAPTILVEIASVDTSREAARLEEMQASLEFERLAILAAADEEASRIVEDAHGSAAALLAEAEAALARRGEELEARQAAIDAERAELDLQAQALTRHEAELQARLDAIDEEGAAATAALATARADAESILEEAKETAERILDDARTAAESQAAAILAASRQEAEADATAERISDLESVHRIEVQVLHERERELLDEVAHLRAQLQQPANGHRTPADDSATTTDGRHVADVLAMQVLHERERELLDEVAHLRAQLQQSANGHQPPTDGSALGADGRHVAEVLAVDVTDDSELIEGPPLGEPRTRGGDGAGRIATYTPLTEQLSTTAFRSAGNDRRGRRRR